MYKYGKGFRHESIETSANCIEQNGLSRCVKYVGHERKLKIVKLPIGN